MNIKDYARKSSPQITDEFKSQVIFHLKNFSSETKILPSRYFYESLAQPTDDYKDFQRKLCDCVTSINNDQEKYQDFVVCSCNSGYFIPKTESGFTEGINYLYKKVDDQLKRIRFIDMMRNKFVYKNQNVTEDIFSKL